MQIGSLVVCVKKDEGGWVASGVDITHKITTPTLNELYVVREVRKEKKEVGILLEEIINPTFHFMGNGTLEPAFNAKNFAEVQPPVEIKIDELQYETT